MFWSKLKVVTYAVAGMLVVAVATAVTIYWPLFFFERPGWGKPKLYRLQDLRPDRRAETLAIIGGTLVDGNGGPAVENTTILIRGHRIAKVGKAGEFEIPPDALQ